MPWRGAPSDARYALLYHTLEREQDAVVRARMSYSGTEAQRILGLAQVAYGDLRGLLAGVTAAALDRPPRDERGWKGAPGAGPQGPRDEGSPAMDEPWSARETLAHAVGVERSYRANTLHALTRGRDDPLTLPAERRPKPDPADTEGDGSNAAMRLGARRAETDRELREVSDAQMTLPSQWGSHAVSQGVDVRFRLHRFASHLVEHTVQCERALEAAIGPFGDARRVVRRISVARAMHERITPPGELARLDGEHEERLTALVA